MTDTYKPRRPLVPGPGAPSQSGIAAKAIAMREQRDTAISTSPGAQVGSTIGQPLGKSPEIFARNIGPIGNLARAISGVMAEVGTIEKGGYNAFHRYHYARMEDLLVALTPLMGKHGLAIFQNEVEIKQVEGNRVAVTYEFSIIHESGELWPEKPRFTGMATARDSKGNWDDKALNKAHTAARKYFLLSLFQVPSGDFEEPDADPGDQRRPVPGPNKPEPRKPVDGGPYKIVLGQGSGPDQWGSAYINAIKQANSEDQIKEWDRLNDQALQSLSDNFPGVYDLVATEVERRLNELSPRESKPDAMPDSMPDPKADPQASMNWIAEQLGAFKSYEGAEQFWNLIVAPREADFDEQDWNMLLKEWQRTEDRLLPQEGPDARK